MKNSFHPKRSLGQHFLTDPNTARWIVRQIDLTKGNRVIEIGPGKGILTQALLETGVSLTAIEKDNNLCEFLETYFKDYANFTLLEGDATRFPYETLTSRESPAVVVGNLPYNVSTQILWRLLPLTHLFKKWQFLFQKEVAERICARVGSASYGALSVFVQVVSRPALVRVFPPRFFVPPPKVDSALVSFEMLHNHPPPPMGDKTFIRVVKTAFSHRRKMLRNNLKPLTGGDPDALESLLNDIGLKGTLRAQNLSPDDYVKLGKWLKEKEKNVKGKG